MTSLNTSTWDPKVEFLYNYWQSIVPDGGGVPNRSDFDPLDVYRILPWIWLVDVHHNPVRFKFRLMGTKNVEAMSRDVTGMWIDDAFPNFLNGTGCKDYLNVMENKIISYRKGPAHYHVSDYRNLERVMMPLTVTGDTVDMILALTVYD